MKLITLNTWGGKKYDDLLSFLRRNKQDTDIFCFQELFKSDREVLTPYKNRSNILGEIHQELSGFDYLFSPVYHERDEDQLVSYPLSHGNGIFWKKSLTPVKTGTQFLHYHENYIKHFPGHKDPDRPTNFQYLIYENFIVINIHGYWNPAPKTDTPERIYQSNKLIAFVEKYNLPSIIGGDFNLRMNTKSVKMLEEAGLRNLVRQSGAKTTRNVLYDIKWREKDKFADYVFVTKNLSVYNFKVMPDVVSDHLPLFLEFDV